MSKHIYLISIFLVILLCFCVCSLTKDSAENNTKSIPKITIKAGKNYIASSSISGNVNTVDASNTELFQSIIKNGNIPYVKLGDTIQIEFENKASNTFQIKDYILTKDGASKYGKSTIGATNIKFDKGLGSFVLNENLAVHFSSNSKDYEPGKTIRGFRLICNFKDKTYEYAFIIRTDAIKSSFSLFQISFKAHIHH